MTIDKNTIRLPDYYNKEADGNNNKLLTLDSELRVVLNNDILEVYESLDLYTASGKTLDLYGETVNQKRGNLTDNQYRLLILTKILRNSAGCDYNSIINILSMLLECDKMDISLVNGETPATVDVINIPLTVLNKVGFTSTHAIEMLNSLLPITVTIGNAQFDGTFQFASSKEIEVDENTGFSDDEQNTGGYLGELINESSAVIPV